MRGLGWSAFLGGLATLLCCALPGIVGVVAGGAAVLALLQVAPWLVGLSRVKEWIFLGVGLWLAGSGLLLWRARESACREEVCERRWRGGWRWWIAGVAIYGVGFFFAYLLVPILRWVEGWR